MRTSVAIDPETGAAEEGALFTYEAIPRATFLTTEVVLDDYGAGKEEDDKTEENGKRKRPFPKDKTSKGTDVLHEVEFTSPRTLDKGKLGFALVELTLTQVHNVYSAIYVGVMKWGDKGRCRVHRPLS